MGVIRELRSLMVAVLFRDVVGMEPVCCVKSAFCFAIAAAASGNMELISAGSSPELRLVLGDGGRRPNPNEFLGPSTFNLPIAELSRLDKTSSVVSKAF